MGCLMRFGYGFLAFIIGLVISIFLIIKVPAMKIKSVLYVTPSIFVIGMVIVILGNLNNWWR